MVKKRTLKKYPKKYVPKYLSAKNMKKQANEIEKSKKNYKKGKYYTRKKMNSYKHVKSPHIKKAMKLYKIENMKLNQSLSRKCGCSLGALRQIYKKGQGAYYSSGSRPNQTADSWAYARVASSITGGKSSKVDYHILEKGCKKGSMALKLAKKNMKLRKTRKVGMYMS